MCNYSIVVPKYSSRMWNRLPQYFKTTNSQGRLKYTMSPGKKPHGPHKLFYKLLIGSF